MFCVQIRVLLDSGVWLVNLAAGDLLSVVSPHLSVYGWSEAHCTLSVETFQSFTIISKFAINRLEIFYIGLYRQRIGLWICCILFKIVFCVNLLWFKFKSLFAIIWIIRWNNLQKKNYVSLILVSQNIFALIMAGMHKNRIFYLLPKIVNSKY